MAIIVIIILIIGFGALTGSLDDPDGCLTNCFGCLFAPFLFAILIFIIIVVIGYFSSNPQ